MNSFLLKIAEGAFFCRPGILTFKMNFSNVLSNNGGRIACFVKITLKFAMSNNAVSPPGKKLTKTTPSGQTTSFPSTLWRHIWRIFHKNFNIYYITFSWFLWLLHYAGKDTKNRFLHFHLMFILATPHLKITPIMIVFKQVLMNFELKVLEMVT